MKQKIIEENPLLILDPREEYKNRLINTQIQLNIKYIIFLGLIFVVYIPILIWIDYIHGITNYKVFEYDDGLIRISYTILICIFISILIGTMYFSKKCLKTYLTLKREIYHIYILTDESLIVYGRNFSKKSEYNWSRIKSIMIEREKISFTIYDYEKISELNNTKQIDIEYKFYTGNEHFHTKIEHLLNHELNKIKSKVIYH